MNNTRAQGDSTTEAHGTGFKRKWSPLETRNNKEHAKSKAAQEEVNNTRAGEQYTSTSHRVEGTVVRWQREGPKSINKRNQGDRISNHIIRGDKTNRINEKCLVQRNLP